MVDMHAIGKEIKKEIQKEIIRLGLVDLGDFLSSIDYEIDGNDIILFSDVPYAAYLEFGTYEFGSSSSEDSPMWPSMSVKSLKKKDLSIEERKNLPRGMVAFAPFRRVIYNDKLIQGIIMKHS